MARINRADVIQKAVNDLAISASTDKVPNETLDKVQLVYSLNRNFSNFVISNNQTTTGSWSITCPTVSTGADTYITEIEADFIKDSSCDIATGSIQINITPDSSSVAKSIGQFAVLTLTAQTQHLSIILPYPLKVKNASAISITGTFSVGAMSRTLSATGFITTSN